MLFMAPFLSYEIIIPSLIFLFFLVSKYFLKQNRKGSLPWNWPLVGMLPTLVLNFYNIHDQISKILQQNNGTFVLKGPSWSTNSDVLFTCDPANVNHILSSNFSNYDKGPGMKKVFEVFGEGLFTLDLDEWKPLRNIMRNLFADRRFTGTMGKLVMDGLKKQLIPMLDYASGQAEVIDLQGLFRRLMFDSSCQLTTGYHPDALRSIGISVVPFSKALDEANEVIFSRVMCPERLWKLLRWLKIGGEKKMIPAKKTIDEVAVKMLTRKKQDTIKSEQDVFDVLNFYMHEDGVPKDYNFLKDSFVGLVFAARDTTSISLAWFFWLLSQNPSVESKIRQELVSHLPSHEAEKFRIFSIEELRKLPYLHAALCETLRLYPPGPVLQRVPLKADALPSGHHVKRNMNILCSFYSKGRMASVWGGDCLEFKPERWIGDMGEFKFELANKYLCAFSAGPRVCPGKDASMTSQKVVAAAIVHNYSIRVAENKPTAFLPSIILTKKHGLMVHVTKRWT